MSGEKEKFALEVLKTLREAGFEAYFAGGCVRDRLLGLGAKDYDIATNALPEDCRKLFPRTVDVGEAFRVIRVVHELDSHLQVEVASFRKDIGVNDGRHPQSVEVATAKEDVERRDFSINGMLYDPIEDRLLDFVGGQEDIQKKIIRCIGEPKERIREDYLRMLRAIRFSARLNYQIEDSLWRAIQKLAGAIRLISAERIFEELSLMLTEGGAEKAFVLLDRSGLLEQVLPELLPMKGCEQPPEYHPEGDVWVHSLLLLRQLPVGADRRLAWGCLLHDVAKPATYTKEEGDRIRFNGHAALGAEMADRILRRLKASNKHREVVVALVKDHLKFADVKKMKQSTLKRFLRQEHFDLHLEQHRIDCMASHENLELYEFCKNQLALLKEEDLQPKAFLRGQDLIDQGLNPSPLFRKILSEAEDLQLEGRFRTREEALQWLKEVARQKT